MQDALSISWIEPVSAMIFGIAPESGTAQQVRRLDLFLQQCAADPEAAKPPIAVKFDCIWQRFPAYRGSLAWALEQPYEEMTRVVNDIYSVCVNFDRFFKTYTQQMGVINALSDQGLSHYKAVALVDVQSLLRSYSYRGVNPFCEAEDVQPSKADIHDISSRYNIPSAFSDLDLGAMTASDIREFRVALARQDLAAAQAVIARLKKPRKAQPPGSIYSVKNSVADYRKPTSIRGSPSEFSSSSSVGPSVSQVSFAKARKVKNAMVPNQFVMPLSSDFSSGWLPEKVTDSNGNPLGLRSRSDNCLLGVRHVECLRDHDMSQEGAELVLLDGQLPPSSPVDVELPLMCVFQTTEGKLLASTGSVTGTDVACSKLSFAVSYSVPERWCGVPCLRSGAPVFQERSIDGGPPCLVLVGLHYAGAEGSSNYLIPLCC